MSDHDDASLKILNMPVRVDATLCEPDEIWFEQPDGTAIRIWPPDPADAPGPEPPR